MHAEANQFWLTARQFHPERKKGERGTRYPKLFPLRKLSKHSSLNAISAVSIYKNIEEASEQFEISDHQGNPSQAHNRIQITTTSFQLSLNFLLFFPPFRQ